MFFHFKLKGEFLFEKEYEEGEYPNQNPDLQGIVTK